MEPTFDLSSIGPVQKPSLLSAVKQAVLPFFGRSATDSPPPSVEPVAPVSKFTFSSDGLRVSALVNFISICGGEKKIKNLSTRQVVEKYILPVTGSVRASYCELVRARDPTVIAPATVYISHAWGARFMDTFRAIKYHFRNDPDAVLWMDIFCLDQRVFYPSKLRNARPNTTGDEAYGFASMGASDISAFASPKPRLSKIERVTSPAGGDGGAGASAGLDYGNGTVDGLSSASAFKTPQSKYGAYSTVSAGATQTQWNGMHNPAGGAGDWCADILKHGMDSIGSVLFVMNPAPNPEPKTGSMLMADVTRSVAAEGHSADGGASPDTARSHSADVGWDRSRYTNANCPLSRLWCLYEIYCTTVVRERSGGAVGAGAATATSATAGRAAAASSTPQSTVRMNSRPLSSGGDGSLIGIGGGKNSRPSSQNDTRRRRKNQCAFDIALHYSILDDGEHNTSSNIKLKKSPFSVDLEATCADFENMTKWLCCMDLARCEASDSADAQRLLHIINVDIGASVFFDTVRNVLDDWLQLMLSEVAIDAPMGDSRSATNKNTAINTTTNKQRLYVQHTMCKLFHIRGDSARAEGAMIELGEAQRGKFGSHHPEYIDSLQYLAEFYLQQHRYGDAEPILTECLERRKSALGPQHPDTIHSIDTLAKLYEVTGAYHLAEPLFEECHELRKLTLGPGHVITLQSMFSTACMMYLQAEYVQTEALMRECLDLRRSSLGPNHLDTIASLQKLGVLYEVVHNYPAAELVYHEYLHATIAVYGPDHVNTIHTLYLLGTCYKNQYKYDLAEQLFRVSIDKYKATLSADHECTMNATYDLAAMYEDTAQYERSLAVHNNYFALCKAKYGEESAQKAHARATFRTKNDAAQASIATIQENNTSQHQALDCTKTHQCMYDLARLHIAMGKCARALPLLTRCLELRLQHVGVSHLDTLATQNLLAVVHINSGNYDEAEALLVQTIEEGGRLGAEGVQRNSTGDQRARQQRAQQQAQQGAHSPGPGGVETGMHLPVVLDAMSNLGHMYTEQGKLSEAEALFMSVWESYRGMYGGDQHPDVLTAVHNLGGMYVKQKKYDIAEFFYEDCLKKRTAILGALHPATLHTLCNLSAVNTLLGKYDIAERMILHNQSQCAAVLGADHPLTLRHLNSLAANYEAQGDLRRAELLYKQCLVKRRLTLGATHPETLSSSNNLACLYVKQLQQLREAERMFKECLKSRQSIIGLRHPDTLSTINNMATLFLRSDKLDIAHDVYIDCTEECIEQLGRTHPVTIAAQENLQELVHQLQEQQQERVEQDREQRDGLFASDLQEDAENDARMEKLSIHTSPSPPPPKNKKARAQPKQQQQQQDHQQHQESEGEDGNYRRARRKK